MRNGVELEEFSGNERVADNVGKLRQRRMRRKENDFSRVKNNNGIRTDSVDKRKIIQTEKNKHPVENGIGKGKREFFLSII